MLLFITPLKQINSYPWKVVGGVAYFHTSILCYICNFIYKVERGVPFPWKIKQCFFFLRNKCVGGEQQQLKQHTHTHTCLHLVHIILNTGAMYSNVHGVVEYILLLYTNGSSNAPPVCTYYKSCIFKLTTLRNEHFTSLIEINSRYILLHYVWFCI